MKRKIHSESGFTLLELLISIAMIAVLVTACLMGVRLAIASRDAGTQKADLQQRLRVLHERLNTTLRSAHLIFIHPQSDSLLPEEEKTLAKPKKILAFEGTPDSLKFVTFGDPLMGGPDSPVMHEVRFYLKKNEDSGRLEILMNERPFTPENFFKQDAVGLDKGQNLLIAQDVAYLKFRYYHESPEEEKTEKGSEEKLVKVSGQWADNFNAEPFDFKSNISDNRNTGNNQEPISLPRAVEVSVGLLGPQPSQTDREPASVELLPSIIQLHTGIVFERFASEQEDSDALQE